MGRRNFDAVTKNLLGDVQRAISEIDGKFLNPNVPMLKN